MKTNMTTITKLPEGIRWMRNTNRDGETLYVAPIPEGFFDDVEFTNDED